MWRAADDVKMAWPSMVVWRSRTNFDGDITVGGWSRLIGHQPSSNSSAPHTTQTYKPTAWVQIEEQATINQRRAGLDSAAGVAAEVSFCCFYSVNNQLKSVTDFHSAYLSRPTRSTQFAKINEETQQSTREAVCVKVVVWDDVWSLKPATQSGRSSSPAGTHQDESISNGESEAEIVLLLKLLGA
jgi:hypothetical protein